MQKNKTLNAEKVSEHIVDWLRSYATNAKMNGFVIGISGGIDSAVTSTLCAMTGLRVLCLQLPIHQASSHVHRAQEHIDQLINRFPNVDSACSDLTSTFDTFRLSVPATSDVAKINLALANARARLRMTTLYYFAGIHGLLVAGTGNKIEDFGVGFYTKYGDGGVDLSPIADLLKSEVFALGKYLQIPASILQAAPTDGLFGDERSDEEQLGATYDELEWAMQYDKNLAKGRQLSEREQQVLDIYTRLNKINQHKMLPVPVCNIPEL